MTAPALQRSETFSVGETARLTLSNVRGRADVQPGEPGVIAVSATLRGQARAATTVIEMFQAEDGTVTVATRHQPKAFGGLGILGGRQPSRVDYVVRAPRQCSVEVSIVEGEALVQGFTGAFELHTVSGKLRLADLSGSLRLHTVSGDVLGERLTSNGTLHLSTVSGDITLVDADFPGVKASTVSGELQLQTRLAAGPYTFNSVSGDIRLSIPADTRCAVSLHSQSGRIRSTVPFTRARRDGEGEAPTVRLHSVSGDLFLLALEGTAQPAATDYAQPPLPPRPPTPPDRRALLEQVSRGEVSVEEAVQAVKGPG